jgi:hypothetical protein
VFFCAVRSPTKQKVETLFCIGMILLLAPGDTKEALGDDPPQRKRQKTRSTYSSLSPLKEDETQHECKDDAATPVLVATFQSNDVTPHHQCRQMKHLKLCLAVAAIMVLDCVWLMFHP